MKFTKYEKYGAYHWRQYEQGTKYKRHADKVKNWVEEQGVLDIGAGDGLITSLVGAVGVDNEPKAVELAQEKGVDVTLCDGYDLKFTDEQFNSAMMIDVLEHFEHPVKALQEARRVIKNNLYIVTPPKRDDGKLTCEFHYQEWTPEELIDLVENEGFELM